MHPSDSPYPFGLGLQDVDSRQELVRQKTEEGLQKVKTFAFIQLCLALTVTALGIATLIVASENVGFPVFNFGPLLTGVFVFIAGGIGFYGAREGLSELHSGHVHPSTNCMVRTNFGISVAVVTIATLSAVFAFLSGAVCAGADIDFYKRSGNTRERIDVEKYCSPNKIGNTVLAFIDGAVCVLIVLWVLLGLCMYCYYGTLFGIRRR